MMKIAASTTLRYSRQLRNACFTSSRTFGSSKNTAKSPFSTALKVEDIDESTATAASSTSTNTTPENIAVQSNIAEAVQDFTSDKSKSGTPSPWAVFDAWGAGSNLYDDALTDVEMSKLEKEAVMIPMNEEERAQMPDETDILDSYDKLLKRKSSVHFGYPYNLMYNHQELYEFMKYSINNLGDPFVTSNYGVHSRQFECSVVDFFAKLWKMKDDDYWGYVTTCGTEGNLHGILLARECHPDGILYSSKETHYSIFKAARYYRMDAKSIPTLGSGEIDYDALSAEIAKNKDRPVIINVNIGTTVKGAVDNLDRILRILKALGIPRERYHIHCDGALFAMMMPFVDFAPAISFEKPIDSIAVSGHKMLGCPMPCGIALTRKEHVKKVEQRIDYLNSVDTTIMGSRNGQAALYLWYSLRKKGMEGIKQDVLHCMETAMYLRDKITEAGMTCRLNDLSSTVVLERPLDDALIKRWQLACEEDIAHVVVMPNVTREKIDLFVKELIECTEKHGRRQLARPDSPLARLTCDSWGGAGKAVAPTVGDFKSA
uniref:Histidine decarboxylase n=1 Tax=Leptocylindrus danicus TaxID=163516 RepID=A0A7S2PDB3_9STRA|mmetsp:Transcript_29356/g.43101  ORF Transcript_29356/g.43101 Transcript_29356/m.43101 type:complete len:545 (+) Transcript_29356:52-1686(+)